MRQSLSQPHQGCILSRGIPNAHIYSSQWISCPRYPRSLTKYRRFSIPSAAGLTTPASGLTRGDLHYPGCALRSLNLKKDPGTLKIQR